MYPNILAIVHRAVEEGVQNGWNEAYDDLKNPSLDQVQEMIVQAIMSELHMYFEFEDGET